MPFARPAFLSLLLTAAVASAAQSGSSTTLPKENPFGGPATTGPAAAATETLEFAGVSQVVGAKTRLVLYDKTLKKSHWIPEGETKDGIAVMRYDERRQQAVVKVNGVEKVLTLRKGSGPVNAPAGVAPLPTGFNVPAAVPVPTAPAPSPITAAPPATVVPQTVVPPAAKPEAPPTPESQAKAETEARMLVSDLLEIGMAQRKAYEEAQRRAAEGNANTPAATQTGTAAPGTPPQK